MNEQNNPDPIRELLAIMEQLRAKNGCPWDREQTLESLKPFLVEETYEVLEAIDADDTQEHLEELGDLLFQIVFQSQIRRESGDFSFDDVARTMSNKLIRRHPHVFGGLVGASRDDIAQNWERIKREERQEKGKDDSAIAGVPRRMPPLQRAERLTKKAARVGFDWPDTEGVIDKLNEEIIEFVRAQTDEGHERACEEFGDIMFTLVNLARHLQIDSDAALQAANDKFEQRFRAMENAIKSDGSEVNLLSTGTLDAYWRSAKKLTYQ